MKIKKLFKKEKNPGLFIYGLSDLLLLVSVILGISSLVLVIINKDIIALVFLFVTGLLTIASRYARKKKTKQFEVLYNLVLEAVCSIITFGLVPMFFTIFLVGFNKTSTMITGGIYLLATVLSVSYNLTRDLNNDSLSLNIGLPVVLVSVIYPIAYIICSMLGFVNYDLIFTLLLLVLAILYIAPIKVKKFIKEK